MLRREYCGESFQIFRKDLLRSNQITKGQFFAMRSYQLKNAVFTTLGVGTTSRRVFVILFVRPRYPLLMPL